MSETELRYLWMAGIYAFAFGLGIWLIGAYFELPSFFAVIIGPFAGLALAMVVVFLWSLLEALGTTKSSVPLFEVLRFTLLIAPWLAIVVIPISLMTTCACLLGQRLFHRN